MDGIEPLNHYNGDKALYLAKTIHTIYDYVDFSKSQKRDALALLRRTN